MPSQTLTHTHSFSFPSPPLDNKGIEQWLLNLKRERAQKDGVDGEEATSEGFEEVIQNVWGLAIKAWMRQHIFIFL